MFGTKRKEKKAQKREAQLARKREAQPIDTPRGGPLPSVGDDRSAANGPALALPSPSDPKAAAREMRRGLQKALGRPVILPEGPLKRATRTVMKHRRVGIGLGVLGASIAAAVTGGIAAPILVITAASLPALDIPTFFGTRALDPNRGVTLEADAVALLLEMNDAKQQAATVQAAIDAKHVTGLDQRVALSGKDIAAVAAATQPAPSIRIDPMRAGIRTGITVIGAGLLLLTLTLIPQHVHGLTTRAAIAILIVGALIVGAAIANGNWLKGPDRLGHDGRPSPDWDVLLDRRPTALDRAFSNKAQITSVTPPSARIGGVITITGTQLFSATAGAALPAVTVGGISATGVTIPAGATDTLTATIVDAPPGTTPLTGPVDVAVLSPIASPITVRNAITIVAD